ncbi:MAG: hypothetical protein E7442_03680 [Ruminococcaceae bacterium]|nr:hypothetical protein [Oscillospiraceae bacterium]
MNDMERTLCGAICIDPKEVLPRIGDKVTAADFADDRCATLFDAATEMHSRGKAIDAQLIADAISKAFDTMDAAAAFVRECMESCPTVANAEIHAKRVHELARDRTIRDVIDRLKYSDLNGDELAAALVGECQDFLREEHGGRTKTIGQFLVDMYSDQSKKDERRVDTGFPRLDGILQGMTAGNLVLIAARPGVGKSAFATDLATTVARSGRSVLFCSMEMDGIEIAQRIAAREAAEPLSALIDRSLDKSQWKRLSAACSRVSPWPLHVCDSPNVTTAKIRSLARSIPDLSLIVVDYIGLMQPTHRNDSRNLELGAISRELKNLAAELRIPIVALCQLNRMTTDTERPMLANIRDSGELEQNATKVLFLWNEDKAEQTVGVSVAKNRNGKTGEVYMRFDGEHMKYTELSGYEPVQPKKKIRGIGLATEEV